MSTSEDHNEPLVAEREFTLAKGEVTYSGTVRIFAPQPMQDQNRDWYCRYELRSPFGNFGSKVFGVDALQALILSLVGIQADINKIAEENEAHAYHLSKDIAAIHRFSDQLTIVAGLMNRVYEKLYLAKENADDTPAAEDLKQMKEILLQIQEIMKMDNE